MQKNPGEQSLTEIFDYEHLPPLDAFEAWARPWDRQIEAARAWQEAQGNTDGEACQWRGTVTAARPLIERRRRVVRIDFPDRRRML